MSRMLGLAMAAAVTLSADASVAVAPAVGSDAVVFVRPPDAVRLEPGGWAEARLRVVVAPGYHVQANPAAQRFLVPTRVELPSRGGIRVGKPRYPAGTPYRLEGAEEDLAVYGDSFEVVVPLRAAGSARPGRRTLAGALRYQACDARVCLAPTSLVLELPVEVRARPKQGKRQ